MTTAALTLVLHVLGGAVQPQAAPNVPAAPALEGTRWVLAAVGDLEVPAHPDGREAHLLFNAGGILTGSDGCNVLRATYLIGHETLKFGVLMGTLMNCPIPDRLDRRLREALVLTRGWRIANRELTLLDEKGVSLARFRAESEP